MILTVGPARARLALGFLWATAARSGIVLAGFVATALLTRLLPAEEVGVYFIVSAIALLIGPLASLSLREPTVAAIAKANGANDPARAGAVARSALRLGATSGVAVAAFSFIAWAILSRLGWAGEFDRPSIGAGLAIWIAVLAVESQLVATLQGLEKIQLTVLFDGTLGKVLAMLVLALLWLLRGGASLPEILFVVIVSEFVSTIAAAHRVRRALRDLGGAGLPVSYGELWRGTWPFLLHQITANIAAQADVMILGLFRPPEEVARYGTAVRLAALPALPVAALNVPIAPAVARLHAQHRTAELQKLLQNAAAGFTGIGLLAIVLWLEDGSFLLGKFFGPDYRSGATVLTIMGFGQCLNLAFGQCMLALAMSGEQRILTKIAVISSILKAGMMLAAVVPFGLVGVAAASTCGNTIGLFAGWYVARSRLGIYTHAYVRLFGRAT